VLHTKCIFILAPVSPIQYCEVVVGGSVVVGLGVVVGGLVVVVGGLVVVVGGLVVVVGGGVDTQMPQQSLYFSLVCS